MKKKPSRSAGEPTPSTHSFSDKVMRRLRRHKALETPAAVRPVTPLTFVRRRPWWLVAGLVGCFAVAGLVYGGLLRWKSSPPALDDDAPQAHAADAPEALFGGGPVKAPRKRPTPAADEGSPVLNTDKAPGPAPQGMVWVPGGWFWMGSEEFEDTQPIHKVYVDGYWMDKTPVTNVQFEAFVKATGYETVAEKKPDLKLYAQDKDVPVPEVMKVPFSFVFALKAPTDKAEALIEKTPWWWAVPGACWRHPEGPQSNLKGRENHPVVHICWHDATAYAKWANKRLPTEAEFEFAARGGKDRKPFCWGDEATPGGKFMANYWQGRFPYENSKADGYAGTSPVGSYPANGYGLVDMAGNVWQWCSDWYKNDYYEESPEQNPRGPASSFNPNEVGTPFRVQRGGSFLCADSYCRRYVPGARHPGDPLSGAVHNGFRCARSAR